MLDGFSQEWDGDCLVGLQFPKGFGADRGQVDVSATQHEMGHFITIREANSVRKEFGFNRGIPLLMDDYFDPMDCIHTKAASAEVEAKAMAWEVILSRDLHGLDLDCSDICKSLSLTEDFRTYEGETDQQKLQWVADKIIRYVDEFGTADDFRRLWHARCEKLPELLRRETAFVALLQHEAVEVTSTGAVKEGWVSFIERRTDEAENIDHFTVVIQREQQDEWSEAVYRSFDTFRQAERWIELVREGHGYEPPPVMAM